jgi:hypothetical protein
VKVRTDAQQAEIKRQQRAEKLAKFQGAKQLIFAKVLGGKLTIASLL